MKSGVYDVVNRTAEVERAFAESAREAVVKACFDTEAIAKQEITKQNAIDTGAARASIYSNVPGKNGYSAASSAAKAKGKKIQVFPDFEINSTYSAPEGIVAVGVIYGFYIEFGSTRKYVSIPPRPYMTPAAEIVGPQFEQYCLNNLEAKLR